MWTQIIVVFYIRDYFNPSHGIQMLGLIQSVSLTKPSPDVECCVNTICKRSPKYANTQLLRDVTQNR